jgi:hypothetical protein
MLYVCSVCKHPQCCTITNHSGGNTLPIYCTPDEEGHIRVPEWRKVPFRIGPKHQSDIYNDPRGEPYTGLTTFIQTPMIDPLKPQTAEQLIRRQGELRKGYKLRDEK